MDFSKFHSSHMESQESRILVTSSVTRARSFASCPSSPKTFCNYCKKFGHIPECTRQPQHLNLHVYHAEISTSATTGASFPLCMSASSTSDLTPKVVQYIVGLSTKLQLYPITSFRFWGIWYMCWVPQQFSSFHLKFMQWIESYLILLVWIILSFVTQAIHWHKKKSPAYTTIC